MKKFDAFICHASEDKEGFVLPLAEKLKSIGLKIWFDAFSLKIGDSLREKIDEGLSNSRYGIVILSPNFFAKQWPQKELNALFSLEIDGRSVILPVWLNVGQQEIKEYSSLLADKVAAQAHEGVNNVVAQLVEVIDPTNEYPNTLLQEQLSKIRPQKYSDFDIRVSWKPDMKVYAPHSNYQLDETYLIIEVANWGQREVIIAKAGLHLRRKDKPFILAVNSMYYGPQRLKDGEKRDYSLEQNKIKDINLIDYAWAIDQVGREWRSEK